MPMFRMRAGRLAAAALLALGIAGASGPANAQIENIGNWRLSLGFALANEPRYQGDLSVTCLPSGHTETRHVGETGQVAVDGFDCGGDVRAEAEVWPMGADGPKAKCAPSMIQRPGGGWHQEPHVAMINSFSQVNGAVTCTMTGR